ncbi:unnamed protein product [Cercospora beticola]|nr:unnamed protein product [Cercospora beticola]
MSAGLVLHNVLRCSRLGPIITLALAFLRIQEGLDRLRAFRGTRTEASGSLPLNAKPSLSTPLPTFCAGRHSHRLQERRVNNANESRRRRLFSLIAVLRATSQAVLLVRCTPNMDTRLLHPKTSFLCLDMCRIIRIRHTRS